MSRYTAEEQRQIAAADPSKGWSEIPEGCPPEIRSFIVDYRAKRMGLYKDPEVEAVKDRLEIAKTISVTS